MKQLLLASLFSAFLIQTASAQNEASAFAATGRGGAANAFVRDYQSIGINPANLGMKHERKVAFGFGELGAGLGSQSLTRSQLGKFITAIEYPITATERTDVASAFSQKNAMNLNADFTTFGIGVHLGKAGGFAFSNRQRVVANIGLNRNFAEVLFLGRNASIYKDPTYQDRVANNEPLLSKAFDGSNLQIAWLNEWNVAYGDRPTKDPTLITCLKKAVFRFSRRRAPATVLMWAYPPKSRKSCGWACPLLIWGT